MKCCVWDRYQSLKGEDPLAATKIFFPWRVYAESLVELHVWYSKILAECCTPSVALQEENGRENGTGLEYLDRFGYDP